MSNICMSGIMHPSFNTITSINLNPIMREDFDTITKVEPIKPDEIEEI